MDTVPERPPIDRTKPPFRDDPVIARLTDEQVWALAETMAKVAISAAKRLSAAGLTVEEGFGAPRTRLTQRAEAER